MMKARTVVYLRRDHHEHYSTGIQQARHPQELCLAVSFLASSDGDLMHPLPWEHPQRSACALLMQISGQRMASSLIIQVGRG